VIFTGVGPVGFRQRFSWSGVTAVRRTVKYGNRNGPSEQITLEGAKTLNLAGGMNAPKMNFLLSVLQQKLRE